MSDAQKMRLVMRQKALKARQGGKIRKISKFAIRNVGRVAGVTLGFAVGAATGDVKNAVKNAAIGGAIGAKLGSGVTKVADVGINRVAGARIRRKFEQGDYDDELRKVGVSEEFIESTYSNIKAKAIRDAVAKEASGTVRGGKALGEVKFTGTMEKETRE